MMTRAGAEFFPLDPLLFFLHPNERKIRDEPKAEPHEYPRQSQEYQNRETEQHSRFSFLLQAEESVSPLMMEAVR
jgi:hypothetical protein